jgi:hypothetical protein
MPSFAVTLAVTSAAVLATVASAVPTLTRSCVLDAQGDPLCTRMDDGRSMGMSISTYVRASSCTTGDDACWCNKAAEITNGIRAEAGKGKLVVGTQSMLDNAMKHSKEMCNSIGMEHQDLSAATADVGCDIFINRENIAMYGGMDVDPAEQCMKQWKESPGHYENIVGASDGDYVSIGVYDNGSEVWCTQTFGQGDGGSCPMVGGSSPGGAPAPAPAAAPEKAPVDTSSSGGEPDAPMGGSEAPTVTFLTKDSPDTATKMTKRPPVDEIPAEKDPLPAEDTSGSSAGNPDATPEDTSSWGGGGSDMMDDTSSSGGDEEQMTEDEEADVKKYWGEHGGMPDGPHGGSTSGTKGKRRGHGHGSHGRGTSKSDTSGTSGMGEFKY